MWYFKNNRISRSLCVCSLDAFVKAALGKFNVMAEKLPGKLDTAASTVIDVDGIPIALMLVINFTKGGSSNNAMPMSAGSLQKATVELAEKIIALAEELKTVDRAPVRNFQLSMPKRMESAVSLYP